MEANNQLSEVENADLLPCPFCGGKGIECYQRDDLGDWKIECEGCGAVSCPDGMRYEKHLAILDWNNRVRQKCVHDLAKEYNESVTDNF
jgi:Restriction alleviation protein Lar